MKFSYEIKEDICHAIYEGDRTLEDIYLFVKSFFALAFWTARKDEDEYQ